MLFCDVISEGEGEVRWVQASPTVDNGVVYIPNYGDGTVAAFGRNAPTPTPTLTATPAPTPSATDCHTNIYAEASPDSTAPPYAAAFNSKIY